MIGDRLVETYVFRWLMVRLNLPGSTDNPRVHWEEKIMKEDGRVAVDLFIYIHNFRPAALDKEECWQASRKPGSTLNYLDLQDFPRKHLPRSMTPAPCPMYLVTVK
jgi:hypothetical protein